MDDRCFGFLNPDEVRNLVGVCAIPNPANGSTIIPFRIPQNCNSATIVITEVATGKFVNAIPVSCKETNLSIEAGSIATGTYAYALYIDGKLIDIKKMVLTK